MSKQTIYLDWRSKGAVTIPKDQLKCSACYAFAATAALESAYFIKSGNLVDFSPQQIIDCTTNLKNLGCKGGFVEYAYEYFKTFKAMDLTAYPYTALDGNCTYNKKKGLTNTKGFAYLPEYDPDSMIQALKEQPILTAMASNSRIFGSYSSGIINENACGIELDHRVLLIGYGDDDLFGPFWIAKNCWGTLWGEKGFFKIKRDIIPGGEGTCGIQKNVLKPLL